MKNKVLPAALLLSLCLLLGQSFAQQSDIKNVNDDVEKLKKNIIQLKGQLREQEIVLQKQTQKSDSIISALQLEAGKISRTVESQSELNAGIEKLKERSAKVGQAFAWRKKLAIIAAICVAVGMLVFLFLLIKKLNALKALTKKNEEDIIHTMSLMNEQMNREVSAMKEYIENNIKANTKAIQEAGEQNMALITRIQEESGLKMAKMKEDLRIEAQRMVTESSEEMKGLFAKQNDENKEMTGKIIMSAEAGMIGIKNDLVAARGQFTEMLNKSGAEVRKDFVSQLQTAIQAFEEKNKNLIAEFALKIGEMEKQNQKKMAGMKDELLAVMNDGLKEVTEMVQKTNPPEKKGKK